MKIWSFIRQRLPPAKQPAYKADEPIVMHKPPKRCLARIRCAHLAWLRNTFLVPRLVVDVFQGELCDLIAFLALKYALDHHPSFLSVLLSDRC